MEEKNKKNNKEKTKHHIKSHHVNGLLIIVIILSIVTLLMIKPSFEHYMNNKRFEDYGENPGEILRSLKDIEGRVSSLEVNYSSCKKSNDIFKKENKMLKSNLSDYETENSKLRTNLDLSEKNCNNEIEEFNNSVSNIIESHKMDAEKYLERKNQAVENFKELANNSAKNKCCKEKVDNPDIDSYSVINNKIECGEGEDFELVC